MKTVCYLDYNATAPIRPGVAEAVAAALAEIGNPSSVHGFGRRARKAVEDAREAVAALVGARPGEVVFTAGGTEANNLAVHGVRRSRMLVSAIEHPSVLAAAPAGRRVPVGGEGLVDLDALEAMLAAPGPPALVSLMLANNETGVIQPVAQAAACAHAHGALIHCDAVQAAGKCTLEMADLGVDMLSLSAHKLGGPQGVGALVVREGVALGADMVGGGQERRRRAGTENVAGIAGFGVAAAGLADAGAEGARLAALRDRLEQGLVAIAPDARVYGAGVARVPQTTCVRMPGVAAETQVIAFDLDGIAVSAGAACSSGKVETSHVLRAMGVAEAEAREAIRISLGWGTNRHDIDRMIEVWGKLYARTHARPGPAARAAAVRAPLEQGTAG